MPEKRKRHRLYTIIFIVTLFPLCDTLSWLIAQHILAARVTHFMESADHAGWHIEHARVRKGGWPFGATLTLPELRATYQPPDQKFTVAWQGDAVQFGGNWLSITTQPHAMHLLGSHVARAITANNSLTLLSQTGTLTPSHSGQRLAFSAHTLTLGVNTPHFTQTFTSTSPSLRLLLLPQNAADMTQGLHFESPRVVSDLPRLPEFTNLSFTVTAHSSAPPSALRLSHYDLLHIPLASMTVITPAGTIPLTAAGTFQLPTLDGAITMTFPHWHTTAQELITAEHPLIPPAFQPAFDQLFATSNRNTLGAETPLSIQLRILNGHLEPDFLEFFRQITTRKIDGAHDGG